MTGNNNVCWLAAMNGSVDMDVENSIVAEAKPFSVDSQMSTGNTLHSVLLLSMITVFLLLLLFIIKKNWFKWHLTIKTVTGALYKV